MPCTSAVDVCLVSPGLPTSNPRLVKEAEALVAAGFRVHCIVGDYPTPLRDYDESLIARTGASMTRVGLGSRLSYRIRRLSQIIAQQRASGRSSDLLLMSACSPQSIRLFQAARKVTCRLYIGHTLAALPAVVRAAEARGSIAGFDAEDCHSLENDNERANKIARLVEDRFLPRCAHLTAAAPLIAEEYQRRLGVTMTTVLNCFDTPPGETVKAPAFSSGKPLRLYWFSQTIGPGRGLEEIITGAARATCPVRISLRGIVSDDYREQLARHASMVGMQQPIEFLPPDHPDRMIAGAAEHDVGLSLELASPPNRDLCLTNKLFTYLAAGRPQLLSRTRGQQILADQLGAAAVVVTLNAPEEIGRAIDRLAADPVAYSTAAKTAWHLFESRYSWRQESVVLVRAINHSLSVA